MVIVEGYTISYSIRMAKRDVYNYFSNSNRSVKMNMPVVTLLPKDEIFSKKNIKTNVELNKIISKDIQLNEK